MPAIRPKEPHVHQAYLFRRATGRGCAEAYFLLGPPNGRTLRELEAASEELGHKISFATWSRWARELEWDQVPYVVVVEGPRDRELAGRTRSGPVAL